VTAKFVGYFRLVEACERPGCPICLCLEDDGRRALGAIVSEQVTDVTTRRRLRASWGFCNWHTWALVDSGSAATGAAILYEDLVRVCQRQFDPRRDRPKSWLRTTWTRARRAAPRLIERYRRRPRCLVCSQLAMAETRYADVVASDDREFARAYEVSTGLCVPHLLLVLERSTHGVERVIGSTLAKWDAVRHDLDGFVAKHEYRNVDRFTEPEATSGTRAGEILAGRRQIFGNDMPRPR
jgi:hypothetical protein